MFRIILVTVFCFLTSSAAAEGYGGMRIEKFTQRSGGDYVSFSTSNARQCARECTEDFRCRAFDFHKSDRSCWLKDRVPSARQNWNVISGVKERKNQGGGDVIAGIRLDYGMDRVGSDYTHFGVKNVRQCARECANDARCRSFGYDKKDRSCWLKDSVPPLRQKHYVISGVKEQNTHGGGGYYLPGEIAGLRIYNNIKRNGCDYGQLIVSSVEKCALACAQDDFCLSFNYNKQRQDCWLKNCVPKGFTNRSTVSGVKESGVPAWAVGNFTGKNKRDRTKALISISPNGDVRAVWSGRSHSGYFAGNTIRLGHMEFTVKRRGDGFETILRSDPGNRVYFRRKR